MATGGRDVPCVVSGKSVLWGVAKASSQWYSFRPSTGPLEGERVVRRGKKGSKLVYRRG
jgi:hypothetical protein